MARADIAAVRREALVQAAIAEIGAMRSAEVTVSRIARRAGVSAALAHHYFGSKERLFIAAMTEMLNGYGRAVIARQRRAEGPADRLRAILDASFDAEQCRPETVSAWLVFYLQAQVSAEAARLLAIYRGRLASNLRHECRRLAPEAEARWMAETLGALIDGLYVRRAPDAAAPPAETSRALAHACLDAMLARRTAQPA